MGTSSLIYAVIVGLWAAYLIPKLTRREALAEDAAAAAAAAAAAVGEPGDDRAPRVVRPAHPATPGDHARRAIPAPREQRRAAHRRRLAARRRRVLVLLLALPLLAAAAAATGMLGWTAALAPLALPALYLGQLRRATVTSRARRPVPQHGGKAPRERARDEEAGTPDEPAPGAVPVPAPAPGPADVSHGSLTADEAQTPAEQTVAVAAQPDPPRPRRPVLGGVEWEPMPITLPTYVTKPKALRTSSRCIDVTAGGGSWTHVEGFVVRHSPVPASIELDSAERAGAAASVGADGADGADSRERVTEGGGGHRRAAGE